jgi:capsular exopolysaccharide synthesis family protein
MNDVSFSPENDQHPLRRAWTRQEVPVREVGAVPLVSQYLRIAVRWRWLILGSIALAALVGVILTLLATPQYTATSRLEISREGARIVDVNDAQNKASSVDQEFYQTQYGLLMSRSLAERVARQLRLGDDPAFFEMFRDTKEFERLSAGGAATAATAGMREARTREAARVLLLNVGVAPIRLSRLVDIQFTSPDPQFSARVATAWASAFIESSLERRFEATSYARRFLEQRLGQIRGRLEESERQLVGYASNEAIINIPISGPDGARAGQERSLTADSLATLNAELSAATADRIRAESRVHTGRNGAVTEALTNPAIGQMRQARAAAGAEYSRLLTQFEAGYPPVQALAAQIRELDQSIAREEGRVRSSLDNAYRESLAREESVRQNVELLRRSFLDQRRRSIQYNIFQREVDTNRQLYDALLQRYKEIGVAGGVGTNNVSIVDRAQVPERPSRPRPLLNLLFALMAGTVIGVALAFIREQIDETITDPMDVETRIGLPLLGVVPAIDSGSVLDQLRDPKSSLIEAYLSIQTNLNFSTDHGIPRTLTVTSTRPAEGKSVTAFAIAYTIARSGARTLLIDGDLRSPSVHAEVGIANDRGLSNYLSGTGNLDDLIQRPAGEPFAVLTAGPQPPNAAELLRSDRFDTLIAELLTRFDHIVIDAPPVMGLADAPILASRVEATVFVLEARGVKGRIAKLALTRLRQGRAELLGAILTKFEAKRAHFGYGYDYGYGYGSSKEKED